MYYFLLSPLHLSDLEQIKIMVEHLSALEAQVKSQADEIVLVKTDMAFYTIGHKSLLCHLPSGSDLHKSPYKLSQKKSPRNAGGQHGDKASLLEKVDAPDLAIIPEVVSSSHCREEILDQ